MNESGEMVGGRFEFTRVFPGSYLLTATSEGFAGAERIEVKDQPLNATVQLGRAMDITGFVEVESGNNRDRVRDSGDCMLRALQASSGPPGWAAQM